MPTHFRRPPTDSLARDEPTAIIDTAAGLTVKISAVRRFFIKSVWRAVELAITV
jgi:hypothetical protein